MDQSTAKAEIAHGKADLREAKQEDIWAEAIRMGQTQIVGEQQRQEKTETNSQRMTP